MFLYLDDMFSSSGRGAQIFFSNTAILLAWNGPYVSLSVSNTDKLTNNVHLKISVVSLLSLADNKFPVNSVCAIDAKEFFVRLIPS